MLAWRLRRLILATAALGLIVAAVGVLPGQAVYDDANRCVGTALASLGATDPSP